MRTKAILTIMLLTALAAAAAPAAETPAVPRIYLPEAKFEFGRVNAGGTVEHLFEVRNVGSAVLQIERVQSS